MPSRALEPTTHGLCLRTPGASCSRGYSVLAEEMNHYVIISGVPASGKTTVARVIARELALPLFDKDNFLEPRLEGQSFGDTESRRTFSRAADQEFRSQAERSSGAIMTSWWKHPLSSADSGTPIEWLASLPGCRVEVHCRCSPAVAARRFLERRRHPGHLDNRWSYPELLTRFTQDASFGPLGIGYLVVVQTDGEIEFGPLLRAIDQGWKKQEPNQQPSEPMPPAVTDRADARSAPAGGVAPR